MSNQFTASIQAALHGLGYDPGPEDGVFGPRTRAANEAWIAAGGAAVPALKRTASSIIFQGRSGYPVTEIVLHCSDTRPDWMAASGLAAQVAEIRRWHVEDRGWNDIGYHWLAGRDGDIARGRAETVIGAGVQGHNRGVIHICLLGGHGSASSDLFSDHFTAAQDEAVRRLIADIARRTPIERVSGHNEWAAKACPGFHVPTWLKGA